MSSKSRMTAAEWSPGRAHLAITKLIGYLLLRRRLPEEPRPPAVLTLKPGQNSAEAYAVGVVYLAFVVASLLVAIAEFARLTPLKAALLVIPMIALALVVIHVSMGILAVLLIGAHGIGMFRNRANHEVESTAFHVIFFGLACFATMRGGPLRIAGIVWVCIVAIELILRVATIPLRRRFGEIDARFGSDV